jgi:uncharacterized protein (UPF0303 family)
LLLRDDVFTDAFATLKPMTPAQDLPMIAQQEYLLRFTVFTADTAFELGSLLRSRLLDLRAGGTVSIDLAGHVLFTATTPGATPGQADWVRRKRNIVQRFHRSSYAIGRQLELDNQTLEGRHGLSLADYAAHGGGFPLFLAATNQPAACVGSIIVSGLPQRDDHDLVTSAISFYLKIAIPQLPSA